jgi:hypothetical protein
MSQETIEQDEKGQVKTAFLINLDRLFTVFIKMREVYCEISFRDGFCYCSSGLIYKQFCLGMRCEILRKSKLFDHYRG